MAITQQDVFEYHRRGRPGKIEVTPTKPLDTQRDLSLAYSPGVAEAVLEVARDPLTAYELTAKSNLVAVISNGTAILGLGNKGPLAAKPVMEGKGVLFKKFADIDVFDIEINAKTVEEMVTVIRALAPTFGGINLEDIKAPECFDVERILKEELDIPVFHDDQHGTAIISGAALLNAVKITGKKLEDLHIVVSGAGASAIACSDFYVTLGIRKENIIMCDSTGVIYAGREENMNKYKLKYAVETDARTLADATRGADVFLGLSGAGVLKPDMVATMAEDPIIFALANPDPEITWEDAYSVRKDIIMATGRADYPNMVNNVLGFPFIFRGALDVYATRINEEMKLAAAQALAQLTMEDVPDSVLTAYGLSSLRYGREYLIPKPLDPRVLLWVAPAIAKAAMESGVARRQIDLVAYREELISRQGVGQQTRSRIVSKAKAGSKKRVIYAEGEELKIIRAAALVKDEGLAEPILIGSADVIKAKIEELALHFEPEIVDPFDNDLRASYAPILYEQRRRKGVTEAKALSLLRDRNLLGSMMLADGKADAFISGLTFEYPDVLRPALQVFHTRPGVSRASGVYLVIVKKQRLSVHRRDRQHRPGRGDALRDRHQRVGLRQDARHRPEGRHAVVLELRQHAAPAFAEGQRRGGAGARTSPGHLHRRRNAGGYRRRGRSGRVALSV